ncbi:MAG: DUF1232 domain-containing protein [Paludibacteraceae bacterium]|nr:DUF1232 domain-containing protein [Paludibacteraceae bacterium]
MNEKEIVKYEKYYSKEQLLKKLKDCGKIVGKKLLNYVLTLYYALWEGSLSVKEKGMIIGALGYFILPIDVVPDFMLPIGYTDDLTLLTYVFTKLKSAVTPEIKNKAKLKVDELLGDSSSCILE